MNGFDAGVGMLLLVALLLGLLNGIVRISFGIVSLAAGTLAGLAFIEPAARLVGRWVGSSELRLVLGFTVVFGLVLTAFSVLAWLLRRLLARLGLGWFDRALGALASGGTVLVAAALVSLSLRNAAPASPLVRGSAAVAVLAPLAEAGVAALPRDIEAQSRRIATVARRRLGRPTPSPSPSARPSPTPGQAPGSSPAAATTTGRAR